MTRRNKSNTKTEKRQIPNSIAYLVLAIAGCAFVYFTFFNTPSYSAPSKRTAPSATGFTSSLKGNGTGKTVINKVEAPDAANAPQLLLPSIDNLSIYRSEQINRNLLITSENQKVELEEAKLKLETAMYKRKTVASSNDSDYGVSNSAPVSMNDTPAMPTFTPPPAPENYEIGVTENGQISLISISKINDELEAMITYNGEVVSLNLQGIVYSSSKNMPSLVVTRLDDQSLCVKQNSKNQCFKVY